MRATMIAAGGLSGGISSTIAGGDFWDGMRQGLITSALNHVAHLVGGEPQQPRPKPKVKWHKMNVDKKLYDGIDFYTNNDPKDFMAVTLSGIGIFIGGGRTGDAITRVMQHEYGHYLDYQLSGDLNFSGNRALDFYLKIGIPSSFNNLTGLGGTHEFFGLNSVQINGHILTLVKIWLQILQPTSQFQNKKK